MPVLNTPGANAAAVAELAVGMMFAFARNIPAGHESVVTGAWKRTVGGEIGAKTLGIVGLGAIGRSLAKKAIGSACASWPRTFIPTAPSRPSTGSSSSSSTSFSSAPTMCRFTSSAAPTTRRSSTPIASRS
ncbi:NAD(P)-dependent oxidoreductase [Chenggangzhangella methanolivorans]|uniref:NAD(P)-dependent oxidoreductase n=1 Tax=Chenggangzhangella methanolivorans TaxID=1437009 RepID=UPI003D163097